MAAAQCNTADPDEIAEVARFHAIHGTTALLTTTVAAGPDELCTALETITALTALTAPSAPMGRRDGAEGLGAHLGAVFEPRHAWRDGSGNLLSA